MYSPKARTVPCAFKQLHPAVTESSSPVDDTTMPSNNQTTIPIAVVSPTANSPRMSETEICSLVLQIGIAAELPSGKWSKSNLDYKSFYEFLLHCGEAYEVIPPDRFNMHT